MKNFLTLFVTLIIAIDLEKCFPKYLLVKLDNAGEKGNVPRSNRFIDYLNEQKVKEFSRQDDGEWFCLFYLESQKEGFGALGNPEAQLSGAVWQDTVRLMRYYENSGKYMLTDKMGKSLTWLDVEDGMIVKIKAKTVNYPGWQYLQPVKKGWVWFYKLFDDSGEQNWKVTFEDDYSTVAFENMYWKGYYLGVDSSQYLELWETKKRKWRRTNCPEIWKDPSRSI